ncbi:MAG: YihY family inner membrane protein [Kangiellaceae bacterium]|nr:YihY family inner membrane protein [Kangiellaceae bacterium]
MKQQLIYWYAFSKYVIKRFTQDKCSSVAAELTVTSLLALVPLTTVVFSLLALIPNFQDMAVQLQELMFEYFVPATGESVQNYLAEFVGKAKGMSGLGFMMLLVTALLMMKTIDSSFNHIWQIKSQKSVVRTFLVYWAVLTLGPIFLGTSLLITSYLKSLPLFSDVVQQNSVWMRLGLPMLMELIAFALMFYIIPNRKIMMKHAVIAAVITALFFEFAKSGFGLFVEYFSTYQVIFGALATIPLFLIWIYLSWSTVLFGAEICHALFSFDSNFVNQRNHPFVQLTELLSILADRQLTGDTVDDEFLFKTVKDGSRESNVEWLEKLVDAGIVVKLQNQAYCLKWSRQDIDFNIVYQVAGSQLPDKEALESSELPQTLKNQIMNLSDGLEQSLQSKLFQ